MPQVMVARVTCPSCRNQIQVPVEQVLDVRADPTAKMRLLNHSVNAGVCPHCRTPVALNLPLFYHDPDKELALVLMPLDAGRDNLERQAEIGKITRAVMDSLPAEERKGYLLQPQVFFTMENIVNKILEKDGVTPEMIQAQREKAQLIQRMLDATSDGVLEVIIRENDAAIDANLFRMIAMNLNMSQGRRDLVGAQKMVTLRDKLMEESTEGRALKERGDLIEALRAESTREKLLELLTGAQDQTARQALITYGRPLVDYSFFQSLTARIDGSTDPEEKERLTSLRKEILDVREELDKAAQAEYQSRAELLRDLLLSENPEKLARRRFRDMDELFMNVLAANLEEARKANNTQAVNALQALWQLTLRLVEEATPPELRLFSQLMGAKGEAEIDRVLEENKTLVTDGLIEALEQAGASMREEGSDESADQLKLALERARSMVTRAKLA